MTNTQLNKQHKKLCRLLEKHGTTYEVFEAYWFNEYWFLDTGVCSSRKFNLYHLMFSGRLFDFGFNWTDTKEGFGFWRVVSDEWEEICED